MQAYQVRNTLKNQLSNNANITQCFDTLKQCCQEHPPLYNQLILLIYQHSSLQQTIRQCTLDFSEVNREQSKLVIALLNFIDEIPGEQLLNNVLVPN